MRTKAKKKIRKKKIFKPKVWVKKNKTTDELAETTGESQPTTTFIEYHRRAYGQ